MKKKEMSQEFWALRRSLFRLALLKSNGIEVLVGLEKKLIIDKFQRLNEGDVDHLLNLMENWEGNFLLEKEIWDKESEDVMKEVDLDLEKLH